MKEPEWRAVLASTAALARTDHGIDLLTGVCESAVQAGEYALAWYGRVMSNGHFTVEAVAAVGEKDRYLDEITLSWDLDDSPDSPGGLAVNTGRPVFTRDVATDARFEPWRDAALRFDIASLVSIPVPVSGVIDGVLTIYSVERDAFDETAVSILSTLCQHVGMGMERVRAVARVNDALESTIRVLTRAVEARDPYAAGHQSSVSALAEQIALRLGLDDDEVQGIRLGALVHDIGKIGVPTELLVKPGTLRPAEMALIREHAAIGEEVMPSVDFPWPVASMVGQHHERVDGSGYPQGLHGAATVLGARVIAVADVIDAMSTRRPYREGHGLPSTLDYIREQRGILFDADVVDAALALYENGYLHG